MVSFKSCIEAAIPSAFFINMIPASVSTTGLLHPSAYSLEDMQAATGCKLIIAPDLKVMED